MLISISEITHSMPKILTPIVISNKKAISAENSTLIAYVF